MAGDDRLRPPKKAPRLLTFGALLAAANIDPAEVAVFRHRPPEPALRLMLPSFVVERPKLFLAYQALQGPQSAAVLKGAKVLAAFIGLEDGQATFAGLWQIKGWRRATEADAAPGTTLADLIGLGLSPLLEPPMADTLFDLERLAHYVDWVGRLVVDWPSRGINWKLRADRKVFNVRAIHEESRFVKALPLWTELSLKWRNLSALPPSWRIQLCTWRGIYYIFDEARRLGYVGSASGEENLLGRWQDYAATGHGGNKQLRKSRPEDLRFSILQLTEPDRDPTEVVRLEQNWMMRLRTRSHGLNGDRAPDPQTLR